MKRKFVFSFAISAVGIPSELQDKVPTLEGGALDFLIDEEISPGKTRRVGGGGDPTTIDFVAWNAGVVKVFSSVGTKFSVDLIVSPPLSAIGVEPQPKGYRIKPADWKIDKLVGVAPRKDNPGGIFWVDIYMSVIAQLATVPTGSDLDAVLVSKGIDRSEIIFLSSPKPGTAPDGTPVEEYDMLIWSKFMSAAAKMSLP